MLELFKQLNVFKTLYFNFKLLPFKDALHFPILIGHYTKFVSLKGNLIFNCTLRTGLIKIGFGSAGIIDNKNQRTLVELIGTIIFRGKATFGYGSKISIGKNGILDIGNNFVISANSTIICFESVTFEEDVLFSWEILVMDTDFHETINTSTNVINSKITKPIKLGRNTWVGTRSTILKGTIVPSNTIIGAGSLLNKKYNIEENCLLAGNPGSLKRNYIKRYI